MTDVVPLIKLSYAKSIVKRFLELDSSNYALAEISELPQSFYESDKGFIPIAPIQNFWQLLAEKYPIDILISNFNQVIDEVFVPDVIVHMRPSQNIEAALNYFPSAMKMATGYTRVELESDSLGNATLQREFPFGSSKETLWSELFTVLCFCRVIQACGLPNFKPIKICFHHTELSPLLESSHLTDIELIGGYFRTGVVASNRDLQKDFKPQIEKCLFSSEGNINSFQESVVSVVQLYIGTNDSIEAIAKLINMSKRTLQRKLSQQGTSYKEVREIAMANKAKPMLKQGMSLADISEALGYNHISSFIRAFKRVTGSPPSKWRNG
ncbi:helix-turn-helix domain-containing protein [Vibrio comitans]|uniref:HTH araC/xylS-type domain-containing protein n=1 Tax=Vibrio comitans NBRC 102076 TaxID=1219078 RepID=A0A4Y3IJJ3_9VIBR|nr:helix-turn-helix domain-containing protein [Vibrio comitans]GEA59345.1 hypothetical protein VCO01S_05380 [Vibrio comitans NBRC 102076]